MTEAPRLIGVPSGESSSRSCRCATSWSSRTSSCRSSSAARSRPRARGGDEGRQADPARSQKDADRGRARPDDIYDVGSARQRAAAPEAARRHREGAGRGQGAGADHRAADNEAYFEAEIEAVEESAGCRAIKALSRAVAGSSSATPSSTGTCRRGGSVTVIPTRCRRQARRHRRGAPGAKLEDKQKLLERERRRAAGADATA